MIELLERQKKLTSNQWKLICTANLADLLDQLGRQPLLALDLVVVVPQRRLERGSRLYHRLGIDVGRQAAVFDYGVHRHLLLPAPGRDGRARGAMKHASGIDHDAL